MKGTQGDILVFASGSSASCFEVRRENIFCDSLGKLYLVVGANVRSFIVAHIPISVCFVQCITDIFVSLFSGSIIY